MFKTLKYLTLATFMLASTALSKGNRPNDFINFPQKFTGKDYSITIGPESFAFEFKQGKKPVNMQIKSINIDSDNLVKLVRAYSVLRDANDQFPTGFNNINYNGLSNFSSDMPDFYNTLKLVDVKDHDGIITDEETKSYEEFSKSQRAKKSERLQQEYKSQDTYLK